VIRALLLDLDDTLLQTNLERFLPAYMTRLAGSLADRWPPEVVLSALNEATGRMIRNLDPTRTLKEAFDAHFYPALGADESDLRQTVAAFYRDSYPQLAELVAPVPGGPELVQAALAADMEVVVATNPLFPQTAIDQRLAWAGFDMTNPPFALVTAYEHMHFAKPQPAYVAEILGRLGVPPQAAAFIGDHPTNDLAPSRALGLATFQVGEDLPDGQPGGTLVEAAAWLTDQAAEQVDSAAARQPVAVLARMRGHLAALLSLTAELDQPFWRQRPAPREWAPVEIVCHLRDTELEVNLTRLRRMLAETAPFVSAADPDQWAEARDYLAQDPAQALAAFTDARQRTIALLANLDDDQWRAPARHALLGPTTLSEIMGVATDHDLLHLDQLRRTLSQTAPG
jgi:FMN phosphatase YigB (HAD superfamily)